MSTSKLFVGNIPFNATSEALESHFAQAGDVIEVALMHDRETGKSRGFAFVTMADTDSANKAIESLNGTSFEGRDLTVSQARPREQRPDDGGGHRREGGHRNSGARQGSGGGGRRFGGNRE